MKNRVLERLLERPLSARTPIKSALAITAFLLGSALQMHAGLVIDAGPASSQQPFLTGNYVAGSEFTTTSALTILSLG
jgi:hypothetical protein